MLILKFLLYCMYLVAVVYCNAPTLQNEIHLQCIVELNCIPISLVNALTYTGHRI